MSIEFDKLESFALAHLWVFLRVGAALWIAPVFGAQAVPSRVRLGLALAVTIVLVSATNAQTEIDILSAQGILLALNQVIIGLIMGFMFLLVFSSFVLGGQVIAMQMGLGFASLIDPQNGTPMPMLSQFYLLIVTLVFLMIDGHLALIEYFVASYETLPLTPGGFDKGILREIVDAGSLIFIGAVAISLPAITTLFLVNMAFGVLTRSAPQLNIISVGFPIIILSGFIVIYLTLPTIIAQTSLLVRESLFSLAGLLGKA